MPDDVIADGPVSRVISRQLTLSAPTEAERLRRAELFLALSQLVRYGEGLDETFRILSEFLVERTTAMAAAVSLVRSSDMTTLAVGYHNLPRGYMEGMQRARQTSEQGQYLRQRAADEQTYVLRNARDYMLERPEYAHLRNEIEAAGYQTLIGVPFMARPETIGIVYLYYRQDVDVDDEELAFARAIGEYAKPFMDNGWLFAETQRRAAELEALSRADEALHESIRLEDVYQAMIDLAVDLLGATRSMFLTFNEAGVLHAHAARGVPAAELEALQEVYHRITRETMPLPSEEPNVMEDVQGSRARLYPGLRGVTTSASSVDIPVFAGGAFFGIFVLGYATRRTFSEDDRKLFRTLAQRAGLAIQNALLFDESQRRTRELEALHRADDALNRSLALEDVLAAMTDLAIDLLGADSSLVATFAEDDRLHVTVWRNLDERTLAALETSYSRFERAYLDTFPSDTGTGLTENVHTNPQTHESLRGLSVGSAAEIPVVVGGRLWGLFSIGWSRPRKFIEAEQRMFQAFSTRASLAIQNALLFEQAQLTASLEERQRIARELHDSVSQALYGIGLGARTLRRRLGAEPDRLVADPLDYITNLAEGGLAETRALIFELIPNSIETDGLATALQRQAMASQARSGLPIEVRLCDEPDISVRAKEALYRIAQESLGNVVKHAGATAAGVSLEDDGSSVVLRITDNGRGFDPGGDFPGHFGLRSMAERARKIGGTYLVESAPGAGSTVTVSIPRAS